MRTKTLLFILAAMLMVVPANAWVLAIKGGKIFTMKTGIIEDGVIVIENNRIKDVGKDVQIPAGAEVLDVAGKIIMPGLFDAYSQVGLVEVYAVSQTVDTDEKSEPLTPEVRVVDAFNTESAIIPVTRIEGVTTVLAAPGTSNVMAGQSAVLDLYGSTVSDMLVKSPAALHINLGESPVGSWRAKKKIDSRMGLIARLRQRFIDAQEYKRSISEYGIKTKEYQDNLNLPEKKRNKSLPEPSPPERDLGKEVVVMALEQKLPVIASAQRRDDILAAIRLAEEFSLKLIILHGTEAYMVADELAKKSIPVLLGPITTQPSAMETKGAIYENAALLDKAGVKFAIITGGAHNVRDLRFQAGIAVEYGLPFETAMKAITINPAEILGVADDVGSIAAGRIANIAIFDGDPLQPLTKVINVIIEGRQIPLKSYQTELYEKFK